MHDHAKPFVAAANRGKFIVLKKKLEEQEKVLSEKTALVEKLEHSVNEKQLILDTREKQLAEKGQLIVEKEEGERKMLAELQEKDKVIEKREAVIQAMRSGGVGSGMAGQDEADHRSTADIQRLRDVEASTIYT